MVEGKTKRVVAYVAVGSNIEPEENIPAALELLSRRVDVQSISQFYRTKAEKRPKQADYRNGVVKITTDLGPRKLKYGVLREIENELGRVRSDDKFGPRTIDLDVILYGDQVLNLEGLALPDAGIRTLAYVAVPLLELAPDLVLSDTGERLAELPVAAKAPDLDPDPELSRFAKERPHA